MDELSTKLLEKLSEALEQDSLRYDRHFFAKEEEEI